MSRQDNFDDKLTALLSAHKPRAWGEGMNCDSSGYSEFNSPASAIDDSTSKFSIGSSVVPWGSYSFQE